MSERMKLANFNKTSTLPNPHKHDSFGPPVAQHRQTPKAPTGDQIQRSAFDKSSRPRGVDQQRANVGLRIHDQAYNLPTGSPEGLLSPRTLPLPIACLKLASRGV